MISQNQFSQEFEIAEKAAKEAGWIIMSHYGKDYTIKEKGKGNFVTTADLEANQKIQEIILGRYPQDGWLSEENEDNFKRLKTSRVWVIDPIDGTKEFIQGIPQFTVSIALAVDGHPVVGVVYNPVKEQFYRAVKGCGALLNDCQIHVSSREEVQGASLVVSRSEPGRRFQTFVDICRLERVGSIAYRLAKVAGGECDGTLTFRSLHEWDICAGVLIVREAGGVVVDGDGKELKFNQPDPLFRSIVASNRVLTQAMHGMMSKIMSERQ